MEKEKIHQIDIEKIIQAKNPKLLKILPKFAVNYIKKIIHQDDLNNLIDQTKDVYLYDFVNEIVKYYDLKINCQGAEHIPKSEPCIIVCNHPLGGLDGIAVMKKVAETRKDIKALVNDLLLNLVNMKELLVPINKIGKNNFENSRRIDEVFASKECIIIFPAGMVSRKQKGIIEDLEWKKSFITKAIKYKTTIIPLHIDAKNSKFFYNLASIRKKVGIKANLEMFFLVNEVYKQKSANVNLTFGKAISHNVFTKDKNHQQWANEVKKYVYSLKNMPTNNFY